MFFVLSKLLDVLLSPLTWGIVLFFAAVPWRRKTHRLQPVAGASGIAILVVFSLAPVQNALQNAVEATARDTRRPGVVYDAVVVLGGAADGGRTPVEGHVSWNDAAERIIVAYDVLERGEARHAIVTGAAVGGPRSDADAMREQLVAWGVDPARIIVQDRSVNTHGDARFTREIVEARGFRDLLLVTSAAHVLRAEECFYAQGMRVDVLPADFRGYAGNAPELLPRAGYLHASTKVLRELAGRAIYRAAGFAEPIPRGPR